MEDAGEKLKRVRERLGLKYRDVEEASQKIAAKHSNDEFVIALSRLSDIETKGIVPSVFRFYSLAAIYHKPMRELLVIYGIDLGTATADWSSSRPARSHLAGFEDEESDCNVPIRFDPGFELHETTDLRRMIQAWGAVPFSFLNNLASQKYTYAFIGTEDFTMYPLIMPGSFIQIDESKDKVRKGRWRSERERPLYFVESREGFTCCWCEIVGRQIVLQSHPLSPVPVRTLRHPQDAEVVGQVVGVAMNLNQSAHAVPVPEEHSELTSDG